MQILFLLIVGAAAGFVATRLMDIEAGVIPTVALGALGAVLGGVLLRVALAALGWVAMFLGAVLGAMLLLWLWREYGPGVR